MSFEDIQPEFPIFDTMIHTYNFQGSGRKVFRRMNSLRQLEHLVFGHQTHFFNWDGESETEKF